MEYIDFTNCKRIPGKAYGGANGKKIAIEYENDVYMLKFPPSAEKKPTELSYTNNCISEHIASSIFNLIGVRAHKTMLGTFVVDGKEKVVCACKDFTEGGKILHDFCSIKNTVIDSNSSTNGTGTELTDILETIERQNFILPQQLKEHFWDMFVVDAFLGNFDRHNGNWGFLYNPVTEETEIAPIYDCGSCLLPQADEKTIKRVLSNEEELDARIFHYPVSVIKMDGNKIKYYDFLLSAINHDCNEALKRIISKINIDEISEFICRVPYISELQMDFYTSYISARFEKIILPAYENIMNMENQDFNMTM